MEWRKSKARNVADQPGEAFPHLTQVGGQAVPRPSPPQKFQGRFPPTAAFAGPLATGQDTENSLGAAFGGVVLARRQFVAALARVEAQVGSFRLQPGRLVRVLWLE